MFEPYKRKYELAAREEVGQKALEILRQNGESLGILTPVKPSYGFGESYVKITPPGWSNPEGKEWSPRKTSICTHASSGEVSALGYLTMMRRTQE